MAAADSCWIGDTVLPFGCPLGSEIWSPEITMAVTSLFTDVAGNIPLYNTHNIHNILLLLLLSRFSRVRLCATPETAAYQALGFSRQEHWSGLPIPSPMHESEK